MEAPGPRAGKRCPLCHSHNSTAVLHHISREYLENAGAVRIRVCLSRRNEVRKEKNQTGCRNVTQQLPHRFIDGDFYREQGKNCESASHKACQGSPGSSPYCMRFPVRLRTCRNNLHASLEEAFPRGRWNQPPLSLFDFRVE